MVPTFTRTLLALCLLLSGCKQEKIPVTPEERAEKFKYLKAEGDFQRDHHYGGKALAAYEQALPLCDKEADPVAWADTAKNLAGCYLINREVQKAEPLFREILAQTDEKFGKDSPESADAIEDLYAVFWFKGYGDDEEALLHRLVAIREDALAKNAAEDATGGRDSHLLARSLRRYGNFLTSHQQFEEAERYYRRELAIEIDRRIKAKTQDEFLDSSALGYRLFLCARGDTEEQAQAKIDKMMEPLTGKKAIQAPAQ